MFKWESQIPESWLVSTSKCPAKVLCPRVRILFSGLSFRKLAASIIYTGHLAGGLVPLNAVAGVRFQRVPRQLETL